MNFCPCFERLFGKSKKGKVSYEGHRQFEEEEFMNPSNREETSLVDTIQTQSTSNKAKLAKQQKKQQKQRPPQVQRQQIPSFEQQLYAESDFLNIKMEIDQTPKAEKSQEKDIQQLIQQELLMSPSEAVQQHKEQQYHRQEQKSAEYSYFFEEDNTSEPNFTINLDPLDPHFPLLHEKTSKLYELFSKKGARIQVGMPNKSGLQIQSIENSKTNTFVLNYSLKCSYSFYISLFKNEKLFCLFSPLIAQAKTLQSYKSNLTLNTLKIKRLGGLQARDCFYVKYKNGARRQHWEIYLNDQKTQRNSAFKTCEVFAAKSIKQVSQKELNFTQYIEIDLQSANISSVLPKLAMELRNFFNAVSDHIDRNYEQQLV